jgi:hypothetical protein
MMFATSTIAAVALALFGSADAHMIMKSPVPFGTPTLENVGLAPQQGPLDLSLFPCQLTQDYKISKMNNIEVGVAQTLSFYGSAVHGGGSCQISVTLDQKPDKNSQWKVIHSIIGGCPISAAGNLSPASATGESAGTFEWTMPEGMPNGQYTLAWTWLNKIGNREFYMNCAPITVSGGGSDTSVMEKLPDMFVANLDETCTVPEGTEFVFPNPGDSVDRPAILAQDYGTAVNGPGCASQTKMGAGAGTLGAVGGAPTGIQASATGTQPAATSAVATPSSSNPGGIFAPGASSAATAATSFATSVIATSVIATSAAAPSSAVPVAAPSSAVPVAAPSSAVPVAGTSVASAPVASGTGVPCSTNGAIVCIGSTQFGVCNWGIATPQALAAGTVCSNGSISTVAARKRRHPIHFRRHGSNLI